MNKDIYSLPAEKAIRSYDFVSEQEHFQKKTRNTFHFNKPTIIDVRDTKNTIEQLVNRNSSISFVGHCLLQTISEFWNASELTWNPLSSVRGH
jgi:hypothetical protein